MKTAVITGISKGIGRSLAQRFVQEGWEVLGTSTDGQSPITDEHLSALKLDLSIPESIHAFTEAIFKTGKKIDILINNAGVLEDEEETSVKIDKLRTTLEVNLIGTIDLTEKLILSMSESGHIVNISSSAGSLERTTEKTDSHFPYHYPAYKISKAALNMYTRTLAMRLKHEGRSIIVSSVHPGWVKTDIGGSDATETPDEAARQIYSFAITRPESGGFWFDGQPMPW